jgi:hypothetical protein
LCEGIIQRHFSSCTNFSRKILDDQTHPLFPPLNNATSIRSTRSNFRIIYSKTKAYHNSLIPYLARILVNKNMEMDNLTSILLPYL